MSTSSPNTSRDGGAAEEHQEAMPPQSADVDAPEYVAHPDGYHSHKHIHGTLDHHYHRHDHANGSQPHAHGPNHPIHADHPDHRRQHVGG
jgi:hypothetical protein